MINNPVTGNENQNNLATEFVSCPMCSSSRYKAVMTARDLIHHIPGTYNLVQCTDCELVFLNPRIPRDKISIAYPSDYAPWGKDPFSPLKRILTARVRRLVAAPCRKPLNNPLKQLKYLYDTFSYRSLPSRDAGTRLLDVGCGAGQYLLDLDDIGWNVEGLDVAPVTNEKVRSRGIRIHTGEPELMDNLGPYDIITAWHAMEHLWEPLKALERFRKWLRPGGFFIAAVPNFAGLPARIADENWCGIDVPRHLVQFTPSTLTGMLERAGFEVLNVHHKIFSGHTSGTIRLMAQAKNYAYPPSPYDRIIFRPIEIIIDIFLWLADSTHTFGILAQKKTDPYP